MVILDDVAVEAATLPIPRISTGLAFQRNGPFEIHLPNRPLAGGKLIRHSGKVNVLGRPRRASASPLKIASASRG